MQLAWPFPIEAVIFDMDGLLLNTERVYRSSIIAAASGLGFAFSEEFYQSMIGIAENEILALVEARFGAGFPIDRLLHDCDLQMQERLSVGIPVKPGVVELLDELAARGLPSAVARSTARRKAERHLRDAVLLDRFVAICTREDVARGKPHPDIYHKAASLLGVTAERCLVLEDSDAGVRAAHAAGAMPIMVPDLIPATDVHRKMCVTVAHDLHEVRALLPG